MPLTYSWELPRGSARIIPSSSPPEFLSSALTAQKESEGTTAFSATAGVGTANTTILSWLGLRTAIFTGPVTGNNGNTHTEQFSQAFPSPFTAYSIRGYRCYAASGTSNHDVSGNKSSGATEEVTIGMVVLSGGTIVSSSITQQDNAGAGHTFTSGNVTATAPAILVAMCSGDGDVSATAPTQTWEAGWTVRESVAFNSTQAPNGHVPMYIATRSVGPGIYNVQVQVAIDEGLIMAIYAVQL